MASIIRIGKVIYPPKCEERPPPISHFQKVRLATFRGSLSADDRTKFDMLAKDLELGVAYIGEMENDVFHEDLCKMLKLAHRVWGYY